MVCQLSDSGANAWAEFEEKVDYVTTEIRLGELGACPMEASQPAHDDYSPTAAMVSFIHFICGTDTNQVVWSIHMKNGDITGCARISSSPPPGRWTTGIRTIPCKP